MTTSTTTEVKVERTCNGQRRRGGSKSVMSIFVGLSLLSLHHQVVSSPVPSSHLTLANNNGGDTNSFLQSSETDLDSGQTNNNNNFNLSELPTGTGSSSASQEDYSATWRAQMQRKSSGGHEDDPGIRGTNSNSNVSSPSTSLNSTLSQSMNSSNSSVNLSARHENENCTLEPAFLCLMDLVQYQRDKDLRLSAIKDYVKRKLGFPDDNSSRPSSERPSFLDQIQINPSSVFSGQLQTLYASCDIPTLLEKEKDTWNPWNVPEFHIYFNIPPSIFAQPQPMTLSPMTPSTTTSTTTSTLLSGGGDDTGSSSNERSFQAMIRASAQLSRMGQRNIKFTGNDPLLPLGAQSATVRVRESRRSPNSNIFSAKLKLYKIGQDTGLQTKIDLTSTSEPCNETTVDDTIVNPNIIVSPLGPFPSAQPTDENIRVSVYWYIRDFLNPLKHLKKKLIDTKMLSVKESKWVEFDIQKAVIAWQQKLDNFGLVVQVENEDNDPVDARKYFHGLSCPEKEVESTLNITNTLDGVTENNETKISEPDILSNAMPPPVLEICTLSIPTTTTIPTTRPHPFSNVILDKLANAAAVQQMKNHQVNSRNRNNAHHHRHRHNHGGENRSHHHRPHQHRQQQQQQQQQLQGTGGDDVNNGTFTNKIVKKDQQSDMDNNNNDRFSLDEDHPLRDILATVASQNSNESRNTQTIVSSSNLSQNPGSRVDLNDSDYLDLDNDEDVIIQKIYISPPVLPTHRHRVNPSSSSSSSSRQTNPNLNR